MGYAAGRNLCDYTGARPTQAVDPTGLIPPDMPPWGAGGPFSPTNHRASAHPVSITPRDAPILTPCGGFNWEVVFDVPGVDRNSVPDNSMVGWIVQKIQYRVDTFNRDGTRKGPPIRVCYFEAFGPLPELPEIDTFVEREKPDGEIGGPNTYGSYTVEGEVRWLPALNIASETIPNGNWAPPFHPAHDVHAGAASSHPCTSNPTGWENAGPSLRHAIAGKWNCCGCGHRPTIETVPSSRPAVLVPAPTLKPAPVLETPEVQIDPGIPFTPR